MRRKRRLEQVLREGDDTKVAMSPLIDCVFLLLIFFLLTSMLKRKEMLIPIKLPDQSSAVADVPEDATLIIGMDNQGQAVLTHPLRIDADRDTPFQKAIDVLDTCKLLGFTDVGLKTRMRRD